MVSFSPSLGACDNFVVPDFRVAHVYARHTGSDDWGGPYVNLWFEGNAWYVRCTNPTGEKIHLDGTSILELECSVGSLDSP